MNISKKLMNTLTSKLNFYRKKRNEGSNNQPKSKDKEALDEKLRPAKEYLEKVQIFEADLIQFSAIKELTGEVLSDIIMELRRSLQSDDVLLSINSHQISRIANNSHKNLIINYIAVKSNDNFLENFSNALLNEKKFKEHDTLILATINDNIKYQFNSLMDKCKKDEDHSSNSSLTSSINSYFNSSSGSSYNPYDTSSSGSSLTSSLKNFPGQ